LGKIALPGLFQLFSFEPTGPKGGQLRAGIYSSAARIDSNTISTNEVSVILTGDLGKTELRNSVFEDNVYLLGRRVFVLDGEFQKAGYKTFEWRADDLASGVYFYGLSAQGGKWR